MQIFRHYQNLPEEVRGAAVAIGNFDGVHKGHQEVIGEAGRIARASGIPWTALTFEPHPRTLFNPSATPFRLTPFRIKARHVEALGADIMIVLHFDEAFSRLTAHEFIRQVIIEGLAPHHVVSGYDFAFGHKRRGDCELLLHVGKEEGFGFTCVSAGLDEAGEPYSSSRVRELLLGADPRGAASLLGRPFEIEGRIEHGDERGHAIGYPTANLHLDEYLRPAKGVYAIRAGIDRGPQTEWMDGVANLGRRPTFAGGDVILEAHLFDFDGDLYGQHLRVALIEYLRWEKKFDGIEDLKAQIVIDSQQARRILDQERTKG